MFVVLAVVKVMALSGRTLVVTNVTTKENLVKYSEMYSDAKKEKMIQIFTIKYTGGQMVFEYNVTQ